MVYGGWNCKTRIDDELRKRMLTWGHSGFSAHNAVRVPAEDAKRRKKLAGYMLRAPMSLEKMTYDAATGTVIYRSKMHAGLKRNFQVMPGKGVPASRRRAADGGRGAGQSRSLLRVGVWNKLTDNPAQD